MATFTVETVIVSGLTPTSNAVSSADEFSNATGRVIIRVTNNSGNLLTVTIVTSQVVETTLNVDDRTVTIANGATKYIGPFSTSIYNDTSGNVDLQFDETASVVCEVITF